MKNVFGVAIGLALAVLSVDARAQVIQGVPVVEAMTDYVAPDGLVAVEGARRIHLRCVGRGSPTVILIAGLGSWSGTWAKVQPRAAETTRVCAWDRAGFGLSDGDPKAAQTVGRTTDDLERALKAAAVNGPYVLVGHSAGAQEVLTFADRHPRAVAGIVLVDPARPHDVAREAAVGPKAAAADRAYFASESKRLRDCAAGVESGRIKAGVPAPPCFVYYPEIPAKAQAALARLDADPARLRTQASSYEEYEPNGERVVKDDRTYGDLPLIVISSGRPGLWAEEAKDEFPALQADWRDSHKALAALSRRGQWRIAEDSSHLVQLDQPRAVVDAIRDVIQAGPK
ncbi:alpha/beta hydrolase [uncultured Caulobacter sp.]|uniref:alpha/beta fold hydrolase n=1 Tax=uncultured Caulobacter sp. TaxID=158749 RepID=UPI00262F7BF4|nr:alpha/beta hydrolase [uncultured Caulobacter sp.]